MNEEAVGPAATRDELQLFPWRDEFDTGIELIDLQHRQLVALLNSLAQHFVRGASHTDLLTLLDQLTDYADYHFSSEESIWQEHLASEPEFSSHCQSHAEFFHQIKTLQSAEGDAGKLLEQLLEFLTRWLVFHILDSDKRLALTVHALQQGCNAVEARTHAERQLGGNQRKLIRVLLDMYSQLTGRTLDLMRERLARQQAELSRDLLQGALEDHRQHKGENQIQELFDHLKLAVMLCRKSDGLILRANPAASELTGLPLQRLLAIPAQTLLGIDLQFDDQAAFKDQHVQLQRADGECINVTVRQSSLQLQRHGDCAALLVYNRQQQQLEQQQLERLAYTDHLTGLANRPSITRSITRAMGNLQPGQRLAVIYFDLDNFRTINDAHGEIVGNRLLRWVGQRWQSHLGVQRPLARIGGDEFIALIPDSEDGERFTRLLKRLLRTLDTPFAVGHHSYRVTASAGVSFYPQSGPADADMLIRQADQAMYKAKMNGIPFQLFDDQQERQLRDQQQTLSRLRLALQRRELILHYQPKVNLCNGRITGVEALLRWEHPHDGLLPPAAFLPLIEDDPLSIAVGDWVLEQALRQLEGWHSEGLELPISVNVAAMQLQDPNFVEKLTRLLASHPRINPALLELEVLESSAIADMQQALQTLRDCKALGVQLALDDFGTGYSSLSYLKQLPVQTLKIDRSFVRDMLSDPDDLNILQGIISLAQAFGLKVIAEGVENPEQGSRLIELGCLHAQGYYIARPMPPAALIDWMRQWKPVAVWQGSADN